MPLTAQRRQTGPAGLILTIAGAGLFGWLVWTVGPSEIARGFRQIGWGILIVLALAGLRLFARAVAWVVALEPPHRLGIIDAFVAVICGDAVGNATPLGPLLGEPAKVACVRNVVPVRPAATALAIENILYTLSVAGMIAAGALALILTVDLPEEIRGVSEVTVVGVLLLFAVSGWLAWKRPSFGRLKWAEHEILTFAARRPGATLLVECAELCFHALAVAEKHLTLWLMLGYAPPLLFAFILETADRLLTVAFKFVPYQVGVGEAGTAVVSALLGLGPAPGVTLSLVRKARMASWFLVGALLLARQGLSTRRMLHDAPEEGQLGD